MEDEAYEKVVLDELLHHLWMWLLNTGWHHTRRSHEQRLHG
jgi:hypothetical protein